MHIGRTRYRCCPECGERSRQKETISQHGVKSAGSAPAGRPKRFARQQKLLPRKEKEGTYAMEWGGK